MTPEVDKTRPVWMRLSSIAGPWMSVMMLALSVAIVIVAFLLSDRIPGVESLGYPAVFLISLFGNATLIVPVPAFAVVCTGGTILIPFLVGNPWWNRPGIGRNDGLHSRLWGAGLFSKGPILSTDQQLGGKTGLGSHSPPGVDTKPPLRLRGTGGRRSAHACLEVPHRCHRGKDNTSGHHSLRLCLWNRPLGDSRSGFLTLSSLLLTG